MKSEDTEGPFELWLTRTPGYLWALLFKKLRIHPITVTLCSILVGAFAGFLFGSNNIKTNITGMCLLLIANWWDCADGQLARMTNQKTQLGRILDGFGGDVWFFSIYLFLCIRLMNQPAPWGDPWGIWIWLIAIFSGFHCHAKQCALADYYRNIHIYYQKGPQASELASSQALISQMRHTKWNKRQWFQKIYLFFYAAYTRGQEQQTPQFQRFKTISQKRCPQGLPPTWNNRFRQASLPLMKYANILTFDLRVAVLFLTLLLSAPWLFFLFEIIILEPLRFYTRRRHETFCRQFADELSRN